METETKDKDTKQKTKDQNKGSVSTKPECKDVELDKTR
jgi:hypothetical protein